MHRSAKAWSEGRNIRKLLAKTSWYKERDPEAAGEAGSDSDNEPFDRFLITPPRRTPHESRAMSTWDRKGGDEEEETRKYQKETKMKAVPLTSVLFVEQTPGGVYAAKLREIEEQPAAITGFPVKVVEKSGTTLKSILVKSDPWAEGKC